MSWHSVPHLLSLATSRTSTRSTRVAIKQKSIIPWSRCHTRTKAHCFAQIGVESIPLMGRRFGNAAAL